MTSSDLERINTPAERDTPATLADVIDAAIQQADTQRCDLAEAGDLESLAWGLSQIRDVQRKLGILAGLIDADVSRLNQQEGNRIAIDGLGVLETKRRSTKTTWDSEALYGRLIDAIAANAVLDTETGQITGDRDTAQRMTMLLREHLTACLPLTASMGWRITGLKAAGIDPDTYREREFGPMTTRILGDGIV